MLAAHEKHARIVHILLDYGADAHVRNAYGLDALTIAQRAGSQTIIRMLEKAGRRQV